MELLDFVYVKGFVELAERVSPGSDVHHAEPDPYTERGDHDVIGPLAVLGHFLVEGDGELVVGAGEADEV